VPKALIAIRYFDTSAQYIVNDFVVNGTALYRAKNTTGPGGFIAADWEMMVGQIDPQYVAKSGDVMSGMLTLPSTAPTVGTHATNKTYVDTLVAAKSSVVVSSTKPTPDPIDSTLWYNTLDGQLYIRYNDGNSTAWVIAAPQPDSSNYVSLIAASAVRYDVAQTLTVPQQTQARVNIAAAPHDALAYSGLQINGSMEVSQERGATGTTVSGTYVCDGWMAYWAGTMALNPQAAQIVFIPGIFGLLFVPIAAAQTSLAAADYAVIVQRMEGYRVNRLNWGYASAQPITIGFWSSHSRPGLYSGTVRNVSGTRSYAFTYTHASSETLQYNTVTIPGCTDGVWPKDNTIGLQITFAMAAGTNYVAPSANSWLNGNYFAAPGQINGVAATSDVFRITGVVVLPGIEAPSAARSPLIMRPYDQELVTCRRYWTQTYGGADFIATAAAQAVAASVTFGVPMRSAPTAVAVAGGFGSSNCTFNTGDPQAYGCSLQVVSAAAGRAFFYGSIKADARL